MSGTIDLSKLPAPAVLDPLDFETILAGMRAKLLQLYPAAADVIDLESEPLQKLLQVGAYQQLVLRARVNDAARACMLAYATGTDLDNLAALLAVERLVLDPGNPGALPPVPAVMESDARLRQRAQLALEGETVAGSVGSYTFHALSASAQVKDVAIDSPMPGTVRVTVMAADGNGTPSAGLLATVAAQLSADDIRPLTDTVVVQPAGVVPFAVTASLIVYPGPAPAPILAAAQAALADYLAEHARLGHDVTLSGLYACLHRPGVQRVVLASPAADVVIAPTQVGHCTAVTVTLGATDV
ncbi:baseplate J/gp47 family protein [uncultured Xylophilus sp.]|uniref:baseplate assembly protein n=1 Tax=uncultured Xylophilus sp. TaxID=296832 RepID=UPI0025F11B45|nr:baseplate J/gp47 family protein [uncultured Xylophilus sp.]